ncbi:MAG TPA: TatD family hydrolase [Acidimicrobiia bacterium]|nr:TatD family hydrolase [Acidimicrobiia bacterium]
MTWVDTHCHLQLDGRPPAELLQRAEDVDWVVAPGVDAASSRASLALATEFPGEVFATCGLHPHEADDWPRQRDMIEELASGACAIGETGLDFYRELSPRDAQEKAFREQISLAKELAKPIIVHCRDAFADVHRIIEDTGVGPHTVLHCWTGGTRWTKRFLELEVTFSFAGPIAFETGETIRLGAELVPPDRALVETDTPYLAPPPHRGEQNEPAWVAHVGAALAAVWAMGVDEVATVTSTNAARVFRG